MAFTIGHCWFVDLCEVSQRKFGFHDAAKALSALRASFHWCLLYLVTV